VTVWRWLRDLVQPPDVNVAWLKDQERRQSGEGIDGPAWEWPVKREQNDAAQFNRYRLRKRA
jgi:hypothetical protein